LIFEWFCNSSAECIAVPLPTFLNIVNPLNVKLLIHGVGIVWYVKRPFKIFTEAPDGAPRDFETIRRSFMRKFVGLDAKSSAPFISGDSFKYISDVVFEGSAFNFPNDFDKISQEDVVFAQGKPGSSAAEELACYAAGGISFPASTLIIHNCDVIPSHQSMITLSKSFKRVYSVNWLGESSIISPLPIGLENRDKRRNGVPKDYARASKHGLPRVDERDIDFLVCFSLHTNYEERSLALKFAKLIDGVYLVNSPITPKQYRNLVLRSKFVISPPGNGPDCHRTWEALYLGAIPIVISKSWPFNHLELPVVIIDSWDQLRNVGVDSIPLPSMDWKDLNAWLEKS
jgi:hypothetical protein